MKRISATVALLATVALALGAEVVDTITQLNKKMISCFTLKEDGGKKITYLHSIGAVRNGILYGNQRTDDDAVVIIDINTAVDGIFENTAIKTLGTINRPGTNAEEDRDRVYTLPMRLSGDTLIYVDSNKLEAVLISDPAHPTPLWTKEFPSKIKRVEWGESDTFYVSDKRLSPAWGFSILRYNGGTAPTLLDTLPYLNTGAWAFVNQSKYIHFTRGDYITWKKPFTPRLPDGYFVGATLSAVAVQGNYVYVACRKKIYLYDHTTDLNKFALVDSLNGGGTEMIIYKNLLVVGGGLKDSVHIFDISKAPTVTKKAIFTDLIDSDRGTMAVDSSTNYLYAVNTGCYISVLNLTPYIPVVTNTAPTVVTPLKDTSISSATPLSYGLLSTYFTDTETPNGLTYSVISNSNERAATVLIQNGELIIADGFENGTSEIVIRATDPEGAFVEESFTVVRNVVGIGQTDTIGANRFRIGSQEIALMPGVTVSAVAVFDLRGRELFRKAVNGSSIDFPAMSSGVQIVRIETTAGVQLFKRFGE